MHDVLPGEMVYWHHLESVLRDIAAAYGYQEIRTPIVEKTGLFERAIGETTDVVEKEMYTFEDRGGDLLSLRPEGTASVVRAALQNGLLYQNPVRLWYAGPMFRRERPQRGRTRQFHQMGIEAFGAPGPDVDAEVLAFGNDLWGRLGLSPPRLEINSLGTSEERASYRDELYGYFSERRNALDKDSRRRLERNPLRILDSKNPDMQELLSESPLLADYLGADSRQHFDRLLELLEVLGVQYEINPRLVRGLDYYSHSVFEWISEDLGAQGTVCAGGRYDGLIEIQGGRPYPGVGFAMGLERVIELLKQQAPMNEPAPHAYLVIAGEEACSAGLRFAQKLRAAVPGIRLLANVGGGSFKSQFKRADRSGAEVALVLGEDEAARGMVTLKPLRNDQPQVTVPEDEISGLISKYVRA